MAWLDDSRCGNRHRKCRRKHNTDNRRTKLGLLDGVPACTDVITKPWVEEAGVAVLNQPFVAKQDVATAGGCHARAVAHSDVPSDWRHVGSRLPEECEAFDSRLTGFRCRSPPAKCPSPQIDPWPSTNERVVLNSTGYSKYCERPRFSFNPVAPAHPVRQRQALGPMFHCLIPALPIGSHP